MLVQVLSCSLAAHTAAGASDGIDEPPDADQEKGVEKSLTYSFATGVPLWSGAIVSVVLPRAIYQTPPACRWCDGAHPNAVDRWAAKVRWSHPCRAARPSYWTVGAAAAIALGPSSREAGTGDWLENAGTVVDSERKRNEGGMAVHLRDRGAALGVRPAQSRSRRVLRTPLRGAADEPKPRLARGSATAAEFRASRPLATPPRGLSCRLRFRLGHRVLVA